MIKTPPSPIRPAPGPWARPFGGLPVLLIFVVGLVVPRPTAGQSDTNFSVAAGTHALTVPWYPGPVTNRLNPAVMIGADRAWNSGRSWRLFYAVNLGFFRHHWWMTGVSIEPEVGIGRYLPGGFNAEMRVGLGYMHYFWRRKLMELKGDRYVDVEEFGHPSVILPLSVSLGYRGSSDHPLSVSPFVSARWGVQGLFVEKVPVMTHLQFLGGVRIAPKNRTVSDGR